MSYTKNRTEILDDTIKKAELEEYYQDDEYYYDYDCEYYDRCNCPLCSGLGCDYEYDGSTFRDGRMIDLDSLSVERKRNSTIDKILGEDPKTRIGDFVTYGK